MDDTLVVDGTYGCREICLRRVSSPNLRREETRSVGVAGDTLLAGVVVAGVVGVDWLCLGCEG